MFAGVPSAERIGRRTPLVGFLGDFKFFRGMGKADAKRHTFQEGRANRKKCAPLKKRTCLNHYGGDVCFQEMAASFKGSCR